MAAARTLEWTLCKPRLAWVEALEQKGRAETAHARGLKKAIEILTGDPYEIPSLSEDLHAEVPAMGAAFAAAHLIAHVCLRITSPDRERSISGDAVTECA